jgi:hypothetical protein
MSKQQAERLPENGMDCIISSMTQTGIDAQNNS